ncbi:MAG: hypothetical protein IT254_01965 [Chitinophagaceae bacterium]|nr:hypothetical protein [Bacteroidota bacterium]MCC6257068.1 hypothetical protein [Chitinophagaceae bacterium]MCW5916611.1 hypothetical protein [Ferruginibacter sp.]
MNIYPVESQNDKKDFLLVPVSLYKNDPNWIRPLNKDMEDVFNPQKNKTFRFGEIIRWVLKDEDGNLIGRIAAFTNKKYKNKGDDIPVGGMGFFECIHNQQAADLLLDNAKHWLLGKGMEAMDGPINFGERDRWWGLITQGYLPPLYCMNYNPPYYQELLENYGFKPFYNQLCFGMDPRRPLAEKVMERSRQLSNTPGIRWETINKNNLKKYASDFAEVYNKAWAGHGGMKQLAEEQVLLMFKKMKPVMDEHIILFAYYQNNAIGMFINIPHINDYFKVFNGKFGLVQKLQFLWLQHFRKTKKIVGMVFGVVPEWQGKGIDGYLIGTMKHILDRLEYTSYEMQWIGDFNQKMVNVAKTLGESSLSRQLTTYRYLFDRTKPFVPHPQI